MAYRQLFSVDEDSDLKRSELPVASNVQVRCAFDRMILAEGFHGTAISGALRLGLVGRCSKI
jgi:hypothetical protein